VDKLQKAPGRGIRRRYDVSFALFFLMKRVAADAGIPLEDADAVAGSLADLTAARAGFDFDRTLSQAEIGLTDEDPKRGLYGMALIVPRFEGAPPQAGESEPLWRKLGLVDSGRGPSDQFAVIPLERDITELTLSHWMRKNAMPHGMLIDYWAAAVRFSAALAAVLAARKRRA
jgi:hypothetical protein